MPRPPLNLTNPIALNPTPAQRKVLSFCMAYQSTFGKFPTTRTIQRHFKWRSQNAAVTHLKTLVRKGRLGHVKGGYYIIPQLPAAVTPAAPSTQPATPTR